MNIKLMLLSLLTVSSFYASENSLSENDERNSHIGTPELRVSAQKERLHRLFTNITFNDDEKQNYQFSSASSDNDSSLNDSLEEEINNINSNNSDDVTFSADDQDIEKIQSTDSDREHDAGHTEEFSDDSSNDEETEDKGYEADFDDED